MKTTILSAKYILPIFILFSLLSSLLAIGQNPIILSVDTVAKEIETIKISEISIKSGEVWTQTSRLYESLLPDEEIDKMNRKNDSLVDSINRSLKADFVIDLRSKNIRFLNNKKVYWMKFVKMLDAENASFASDIKLLNKYIIDFKDEILVWENTKATIKQGEVEPTVVNRVVELIVQLNGVVSKVQKKNDKILTMLDRTTELGVRLTEYIDRIDNELITKKSEIFVQDQSAIFLINFTDSDNWKFKEPILFFYRIEVVELGKYIMDNISYFILQLLLIVLLIVVFSKIKNRLIKSVSTTDTIYKRMLVRILKHNISAALIISFFASVLIFSNRPELFKDIIIIFITFPLIVIATTFVEKRFFRYLYVFGAVILLQMLYTIFPPDNLFFTTAMIIVAFIELISFWKLLVYFYKNPLSRKLLSNLIVILIVISLGFAIVGLLGVLYGTTMLAEVAIAVPIVNVFSGILVFTTAIIFNGLIEIGIESPYFQKLNFVRLYGDQIRKRTIGIINFMAITIWLYVMMGSLNIARAVISLITSFFTYDVSIGLASFTLWDIIIFFLVIWLSIVISKMIRILLEQDILIRFNLGKGIPYTIAMLVRYSIITIGILLAVAAAGMPLDNLTVLFGAFGVGIGFGLQNIFNNLVSGFILLFERPIQIGDTIEVGELIGSVKSIGIRSSNIRTFDGAEVIVPNGQLISNEVVNWTLSDQRRRIEIIVGVAYGSDPHKVKELMLKVLNEHHDIIDEPEPYVYFNALGESSLDFRLLFWTSYSGEWIRIRSEVMFKVHDILQEEGISIPFPQMDLHIRSVDKGVEIVKKDVSI